MSVSTQLANRRRVLQGLMGGAAVTVGLPFLDCFLTENGTALAATGAPLPVCFGTWFWGLGLNPGRWEPQKQGAGYELPPDLAPIGKYKNRVNVFTGMKVHLDGKTAHGHFSGNTAALTGTAPPTVSVTKPTIDTLIADVIGAGTRFRSLEVASTGNANHIYSFRAGNVLNPAEVSPAALYMRIFGPEFTDPNAASFTPDPEVMARQSVLSVVKEQRKDLERKLGAADRARLDEYFTSVRQVEQQVELQLQKPAPLEACTKAKQANELPPGTEIETVTANHKLFAQILAHALACNQTRVINVVFNDATSSLRKLGSQMIHHIYTHEEQIDEKLGYQANTTWFIQRIMEGFHTMLATLDGFREGDGTLLDRTLLFATTDVSYAKIHSLENFPMMTAGGAGGRVKTGIHVAAKGDPISRVGLTIQQALGLPIASWGTQSMETSKTITEILA